MKMRKFIAKRLFFSIFVLLGLSIFIFTISRIVPGDPARLALGALAPEWSVQKLREELHLNEPLYVQYWIWISNAFHLDFGKSLVTQRPILDDVVEFFPATLELVIFSVTLSVIISISVGVTAGRNANSLFDNFARIFSYLGIAMPSFIWGILMMFFFSFLIPIFPTMGRISQGIVLPPRITGMVTVDSLISGNFKTFLNVMWHMILPGTALSVARIAQHTRLIRSSVVENLGKDYIAAAESYGLPERLIMFTYLLKPSLIPSVSILGLDIAAATAGSFVIETIFGWPGFGRYSVYAMLRKDLNAVIGSVMIVGVFFALINIVVDILVGYLDPRIRLSA